MYDWDSDGSHDMIGGFTTTVDELAASQHGKEVGDLIEPPHDKTNKMACVPSEDSDQTGRMPRLI